MSTWQITAIFALAACAIGCLLGICKAIERLSESIKFIRTELTKIDSKLEAVEVVNNRDDLKKPVDQNEADHSLEALEAAISSFEKLKRIDITKPGGAKA